MALIGDLHLHSRYSQACSKKTTIPLLEEWGRKKGIDFLASGDIAHPLWREEVKRYLKDRTGEGVYTSASGYPFVLEMEISLIYTHLGRGRRVHHVILFPSMEVVEQVVEYLSKRGRLDYDGRPIFKITSEELVRDLRAISQGIEVIPAHIWTPWFAMFGSKSGYDSFKDCFGSQSHHVHAIETGMSSDPPMNWRVKGLDEKQIVSFSDSHSYWPWRLGREATLFGFEDVTYDGVLQALRKGKRLAGTIETEPAYGRYHWDGHRNCGFSCPPSRSKELHDVCPVCGKPLTIGVDNRVEELASRPKGYERPGAPPFWKLAPLHELISAVSGKGLATKGTWATYHELLKIGGSENRVLLETPARELARAANPELVEAVMANREQRLEVTPGFDGEYGKLNLKGSEAAAEPQVRKAQKGLRDYFS